MILKVHASINLTLNLCFFVLLASSLAFNYFSFLNYKVGLFTITHPLQYEDVGDVQVFTYFQDFKTTACQSSKEEGILTMCSNIDNFEVAGFVYAFFASFLLIFILASILNLVMLITTQDNFFTKIRIPHYINAAAFVLVAISYMLLSNIDNITPPNSQEVQVQTETGIEIIFSIALVAFITLFHYLFVRKFKNLDYLAAMTQSLASKPSELERPTETPSRTRGFFSEKSTAKLQSPDMEEIVIKPKQQKALAESGAPETTRENEILKTDNERLIKEINSLRRSLEEAKDEGKNEKFVALNNQIDTKEEEIQRLRNLLEALRKQLLQKDIKIEEIDRNSAVNQQAIDALKENKEELNKFLMEREKRIEELRRERDETRRELGTKNEEYDALIAELNNSKREILALKEGRSTEISIENIGSGSLDLDSMKDKISQLSKALEMQREQTNSLISKNQNLEMAKDDLDIRYKQLSEAYDEVRKQFGEISIKYGQYENIEKERIGLLEKINDLNAIIDKLKLQVKEIKIKNEELEPVVEKYEMLTVAYNKIKEENGGLNRENENLRTQNENLVGISAEKVKIENELDKTKKVAEVYQNQLQELREKYQTDKVDWDEEKSELNYAISQLKREVEQLQSRLKSQENSLDKEIQELTESIEKLKDEVKYYKTQYDMTQGEVERLRHLQDALKQQLVTRDSQLDELSQGEARKSAQQERLSKILSQQNAELDNNLKDTEKKLKELLDEKEELRKQLTIKSQELSDLSSENQNLHKELFEIKLQKPMSPSASREENKSHSSEMSFSSSISIQELMIIESLAEIDIKSNPLMKTVSKMKKEPPMSYSNVWKLFENMMQEKYKLDRLEMALGRQPRSIIDFTLDFMYLQFGLKTLALKQLKALISSLEELFKINHPYGTILCRLLGIFHSRPIPTHVAAFLIMVNELFNTLTNKTKLKFDSFAQQYEIQQYGGNISIVDAMELIMKICKNQRDRGERIIYSLKRDTDNKVDMIIIKVCGTMAKMNKGSDYMFEILDLDRQGTIDYHEFVDAIRIKLNIWVTQEEAEDLCAFIDENARGIITHEEWNEKINFSKYLDLAYSNAAMVTKAQLFNAILEEYEHEMIEEYTELRQSFKHATVDQSMFNKYIGDIDPTIEEHEIARLYEEARNQDMDIKNGISAETLCIMIIKEKIGGYGIGLFGNFYVDLSIIESIMPRTSSEVKIQ